MEIDKITDQIIDIPAKYHELRNISVIELLKQTGYLAMTASITETDIFKAIILKPESIEYWKNYSEDKRTSSGWYFIQNDKKKYVIGYYPTNEIEPLIYDDVKQACAAYIFREVESWKKSVRQMREEL